MDEPKKTSSRPGKIIKLVAVFLFVGFIVAIVIPNFIHARLAKASNACVNNLRQIESAKEQWAMENNKRPDDIPPATEIVAYFKDHRLPARPEGGTYTIGRVNEDPQCSISTSAWPNDHVLNVTNSWWIDFKAAYGIILGKQPRSVSP